MIYRGLADLILVLHFCFVLFVVFGGALVLYRRFFLPFHLPSLAWGILVEFFQLPCPLTSLENQLRTLGGEAGYAGGFVENYIFLVLYPSISPQFQIFLGALLIVVNLLVYAFVLKRKRLFAFSLHRKRI
ncbi:MAG TPA: DUF2784 domain-containing protein [Pyrinomonadaceae bacterium]|nr:DUF2784 domain-containing protein [Pyrinomonadaceae bacterium]